MAEGLRTRTREGENDLQGTVCLVTGSSRGIGRAIAEEFGRRGANVVVTYRSSAAAARDVADGIDATVGNALALQGDVTDRDRIETMRERVHDAFGPVDVLVNNAGITADRRFEEMTPEEWDRVLSVCLDGTFNCTNAFFADVRDATDGRLINISSVVGEQGNYGQANYAAAKSALSGFTRSLARELASHGSTANCIAPGYTRTDMVTEIRDDVRERLRDRIPVGRFANPEEVAHLAGYLASPRSSYMTGEVLNLNGGLNL
ncbi:beta-ketoacyl-ACP reductase [Haloplanus halophilus]|uniref:beta-ketoacyl-ACP reductase n=1 Tax=Haloplanus halophilus TaxID=2949993 RepID=UPI00203C5050|nr:beta-ketoacyl-ACP reductase [Haloplanus sp. GDY1]